MPGAPAMPAPAARPAAAPTAARNVGAVAMSFDMFSLVAALVAVVLLGLELFVKSQG